MIELPIRDFTTEENRPFRWGDCQSCPLNPPNVVRGWGTSKSGISIIGESPGITEIQKGRPFIGPSGQLIRTVLARLGQDPDECYWTNALLCHAAKPNKDSIVACNERLHEELWSVGTQKVLLLGAIALQSMVSPRNPTSIVRKRGQGFYVNVNGKPTYTVATYHPAAVLRDTELFRDLVSDVDKFLRSSTPVEPPKPHVYISWNVEQALRRLPSLLSASRISCDIETTGLSNVSDLIISVGFGVERLNGEHEVHIIPNHVFEDERVKPLMLKFFTEYSGALIFHNGKFDLRMLQHFYQRPLQPKGFADTMLMSYTLDERSSGGSMAVARSRQPKRHGLKVLSRVLLDADDYTFDWKEFFGKEKKTKEDYERLFYYQGLDCSYTMQLYNLFEPQLEEPQRRLLDTLLYPAAFVFQDIENHGVRIDLPYLVSLEREISEELVTIGTRIAKLVASSTGRKDWRAEGERTRKPDGDPQPFNPGSSIQVKELIYTHWQVPYIQSMSHMAKLRKKQGKEYWPTDHVTLAKIAEKVEDPVRREVLKSIAEWRKKRVVHSTNVVGMLKLIDPDHRVRPSFLLHGTVTGRLSCANPNLQNIPVREGNQIHSAFAPGPGMSIVEADFSQLEVRVLAEFSRDPALLRDCSTSDIHGDIAVRIFNKPAEEITQFERTLTKTIVFGVLYGRSAEGILAGEEMAELVKRGMKRWSKDETDSFIRRFLSLYPGLDTYFKRVKKEAIENHYVEYSRGRRRRFPFITDTNRAEVLRQAVNAPVQGTASDICLDALIRLHQSLANGRGRNSDARILSVIHDAILIECRDERLEEIIPIIQSTMEDVQIFKPSIPFKVKVKVGPDWGHTQEYKAGNV